MEVFRHCGMKGKKHPAAIKCVMGMFGLTGWQLWETQQTIFVLSFSYLIHSNVIYLHIILLQITKRYIIF